MTNLLLAWMLLWASSGTEGVAAADAALGEAAPIGIATTLPPQLEPHRGEVILLDFWASWCTPCRASFPWMSDMQRTYGELGLTVIAVNLDEEPGAAQAFLEQIPHNFGILLDPEAKLAERFKVPAMPSSILFDREGNVALFHAGFRSRDRKRLERRIVALLEGATAPPLVSWDRGGDAAVKPWERSVLARPDMALDCERMDLDFDDHVYFSKEASSGGRGFGGGGCGCN